MDVERRRRRRPGVGFWLVLVLVAVYLVTYSGVYHSIDEVSVSAMTESLVKHGKVSTDQILWSQDWTPSQGLIGPDGHVYSKKGIGLALLGAPFYWLGLVLPHMGLVGALMLANAFATGLTAWLLYDTVRRLEYGPAIGAITALGFGLATMAWPYARYFFTEPLAGLGLMAGLWGLLALARTGRLWYAVLAGAGLGLALLTKVVNGAVLPFYVVFGSCLVLRTRKREADSETRWLISSAVAFLLPLIVAILGMVAYNLVRTGQPLASGYTPQETFSTPFLEGLGGLLLSPGKSLFLYSPILLVALLGIPALIRRNWPAAMLSLSVVVLYIVVHAGWYMWWGGWSWGPRFLVPVVPLLCLYLAPVAQWALGDLRRWARVALVAAALVSIGVQLLGVTVDFNRYLLLLYERGIESGQINFDPGLSPLAGHWELLGSGSWDVAWVADILGDAGLGRLMWPLALLAVSVGGWLVLRSHRRSASILFTVAGIGLLAGSVVTVVGMPEPAGDWQQGCQALSETLLDAAQPEDVLIADYLPYGRHLELATSMLDRYKAAPPYWGWARQEPVSEPRQEFLGSLGQDYRRLWLALESTPETDPASTTERWLDEHAYRVTSDWLSPALRLVRYELPAQSLGSQPRVRQDLLLGDRILLDGHSPAGPLAARAGKAVTFSLFWQVQTKVEDDYVVFVQLLGPQGNLVAQVDRSPVGGFRPTSSWQPGEVIRDNYGLDLPQDLLEGSYTLIAGLYLPSTMERLEVTDARGTPLGDHVVLMEVAATGGEGP